RRGDRSGAATRGRRSSGSGLRRLDRHVDRAVWRTRLGADGVSRGPAAARALLAHHRGQDHEPAQQEEHRDDGELNLRVVVDRIPQPTTCSIPLALWPLAASISLKSWGLEAVSRATSSETTPCVTYPSNAWSKVCIP